MIYVLTYDHPHRKTQDVLMHLTMRGYRDVMVMAMPWVERKNFVSLFGLKPEPYPYWPEQLCQWLDYEFIRVDPEHTLEWRYRMPKVQGVIDVDLLGEYCHGMPVLIAGAPILPTSFINTNTIINSHCGWLPQVRGLDALKWAIYYDEPIGVTTHIIGPTVDIGKKIERREVPLYTTDDLYKVAMRQYEMEIQMLIDAIDKWKGAESYNEPANEPTRRMPHRLELVMKQRFEDRVMAINE